MAPNALPTPQVLGIAILLLDIAVKSFALLLATAVASWALRKRSAATLHRLWTLAFVGCLLMPAVALLAPAWRIPLLPSPVALESDAGIAPAMPAESLPTIIPEPGRSSERFVPSDEPRATVRDSNSPMFVPSAALDDDLSEQVQLPQLNRSLVGETDVEIPLADKQVASAGSNRSVDLAKVVLACWALGAALFLMRMAWQQIALARLLKYSAIARDEEWLSIVVEASTALSLRRRVELRRIAGATSPICAGIVRSVIAVPDDADAWDRPRRRLVLLHELAHVKRCDVLTQTLAGLVCAFHWFNPIGWLGLSQMRKLRELACDDLVLACGQRPADYASALLDVARSYRHENLAAAVGMVRRANVESRILALLDEARSHGLLSQRAARSLLALAAALSLLFGTVRLESRDASTAAAKSATTSSDDNKKSAESKAEVAKSADKDAEKSAPKPAAAPDEMRTMAIHVRDEDGKPIEGVNLRIAYRGAVKNIPTDANGFALINIPSRLARLQVRASHSNFVPQVANFDAGKLDAEDVPTQVDFVMPHGSQLGGRITDEDGKPISSVSVQVRVLSGTAGEPNSKSTATQWLKNEHFDEEIPSTDIDGRWSISNAPRPPNGKDYQFSLLLTHKDYVSDHYWGFKQIGRNVTSAELRDGSATIVMTRGIALRGVVQDDQNRHINQGEVIFDGDTEAKIQIGQNGTFKTFPLAPGTYPIVIVAPGFMPERRMVTLSNSMEQVKFQLRPGKRIMLSVVDKANTPIANAKVEIWRWRGVDRPFGFKSAVPGAADGDGNFVWNWAPQDAVTYTVSAPGYSSNEVTLVPTERITVVNLVRRMLATGRVNNSITSKPVKEFRVIPVRNWASDIYSTTYGVSHVYRDGEYQIDLNNNAMNDDLYHVRIESVGYRSALSKKGHQWSDGDVRTDFSLEPAKAREGIVVDARGKPVEGACVVEASPTIVPDCRQGIADSDERRTFTGPDGKFASHATFEPVRFRVTHASGFGEVLRQPNEPIGTIEIDSWARVTGQLLHDGKPVADEFIYFYPVNRGSLGEPRFQDRYFVQTNAEGQFEFDRLPAIAGAIRANPRANPHPPSVRILTSVQSIPLDLKPGEHRTVIIGGSGVALTGKVVATGRGGVELNKKWSINYLVRRGGGLPIPDGLPELSLSPNAPIRLTSRVDPKRMCSLDTRDHYFVEPAPDGQFQISGVPAGTYDFVLQLYEYPTGCLVETIGEKVVTIEVTEAEAKAATKDVGVIEVPCRVGPRVGQSMERFSFIDATGRQRFIADMKGQLVLMHVWASWCAPCLASMPDVSATAKSLGGTPITFVGLNIDEDAGKAKALVERHGWNWAHNYLGAQSNMTKQLAISSVPIYYLIGPDGNLAATATEWSEMKTKLDAAFKQSGK